MASVLPGLDQFQFMVVPAQSTNSFFAGLVLLTQHAVLLAAPRGLSKVATRVLRILRPADGLQRLADNDNASRGDWKYE